MYKKNISVENGEEENIHFEEISSFSVRKTNAANVFHFLRIYLFNLFGWAEDVHAVDTKAAKEELTM